MRPAPVLAAAAVRVWTRAYTAGLDPSVRESRRAEIDSDLWEHAQAAQGEVADPRSLAGQMLARCLLGIAADLTWRSQIAASGRLAKEGVPMNEHVKRNWWIPALIVLSGLSALFQLTHELSGFGSDPSLPGRVGPIAVVGSLFVVLPIWALVIRRQHPGWTVVMLLPIELFSLGPLVWGEVTGFLILPVLGIVTFVGAVMNLAERSVEEGTDMPSLQSQRAPG